LRIQLRRVLKIRRLHGGPKICQLAHIFIKYLFHYTMADKKKKKK